MITPRKFQRRKYETTALLAARKIRVLYLFWTRRGRKSTTLGNMAFDAMSTAPGQSVIAASASLLVGSELVSMAMNATEQAVKVANEAEALRAALETSTESQGGLNLVVANSETGKIYQGISADDYKDLYTSKRLEFRLYFNKTSYSRLIVIAPNPATARGWGGWVFRDEQMFTSPEMERELQTATDPIIDTDPTFRLIYASNLCGDDRHPGYEMTLPREPMRFAPDASGHLYVSQTGITVHRVDLADAYEAGHTLFNKKGGPMSLEEALAGMTPSAKKQNYKLVHEASGTAAVDALAMNSAQERGIGRCASIYVDSERDFEKALRWLGEHLTPALKTAAGFDVATTTDGKSNPSSVTITQQNGIELVSPLNVVWKTRDPILARERISRLARVARDCGAPLRRLCIDASNERYFAEETKTRLRGEVPVVLVINGATVEPKPPGYDATSVNYKTFLGDQYAAQINENRYVLPPESYFKKDHRSVVKERGTYSAEVDLDGGHADTFDSGKLAQHALSEGGDFESERVEVEGRSRLERTHGALI